MLSVGGRPLEDTPVRDVHQMLAGLRGESAQRIKASMAATALHQCVQSLHMKMSVSRLLLRPNLDQRELHAAGWGRGAGGGERRGRGRFGAHGELCMKWKFARCAEQICACMGMLIIMSGEICQFAFASLHRGHQSPMGAVDLWLPAGPNEVVSFPGHQNGSFTVHVQRDWCSSGRKFAFYALVLQYICFLNFSRAWEVEQHPPNFPTGQLTDSGMGNYPFFCTSYCSWEVDGIFYQTHTFQLRKLSTLTVSFALLKEHENTFLPRMHPIIESLQPHFLRCSYIFQCDCSSLWKLVIPQPEGKQTQPSSSHLHPSFLYPPITPSTSPGGGGGHMLQTCFHAIWLTSCHPYPRRESSSAGYENSPHAADPRTPERKKNCNSRGKGKVGQGGVMGDVQTTVQVRKKILLLEKMITCVTISLVLLSN